MNDDLLGVRPEDLDPASRRRQDELLSTAEGRRDHEEALALGAALRGLPGTGGPTEEDVRDAIRGRSYRWQGPFTGVVALATAAAAVLLNVAGSDTSRERGLAPPRLEVHLEAAAEGPAGVRPLSREATVRADERVLFRVSTRGEGYLSLIEGGGASIWPPSGQTWEAGSGTHVPGGDRMVSYRPDEAGAILGTYVASFCADPEGTSCVTDTLALRWAP